MTTVDEREEGVLHAIDRHPRAGGSMVIIAFLVGVDAFCIALLVYSFASHSDALVTTVLFGAYPILTTPILGWEVSASMPKRLELTQAHARLYRRGKLVAEIPLDSRAMADLSLESSRLAPNPKTFSSCHEASVTHLPLGGSMTLCGISLARNGTRISCHYDDGWRLVDLVGTWEVMERAVKEHGMRTGASYQRYREFRRRADATVLEGEGDLDDLFDRLRRHEF